MDFSRDLDTTRDFNRVWAFLILFANGIRRCNAGHLGFLILLKHPAKNIN